MLDRWPDVRVPFVPQLEDADCGPACLSAVMSVHGIRESVARLAQRCETGRDGTGMAGLAAAADEFGLRATPLRVRAEADLSRALGGIPMPVIAPITGHHFVVIEQVTSREVRVMDPAVGHRRESIDWLKENFGGIVLAVMPGRIDGHPGRPVPNWAALVAWRTWRTAGTERGQAQAGVLPVVREEVSSTRGMLAIGICASVIAAGLGLLGPIIARRSAFTPDDAAPSGPAAALALVAAATFAAIWVAGWARSAVLDSLSRGIASRVVGTLLTLPAQFFERRFAGEVALRPQRADGISTFATTLVVDGSLAALTVTSGLVGLFIWEPVVAAVVALATVGGAALSSALRRPDAELATRLFDRQQALSAQTAATITALEPLLAETTSEEILRHWAALQDEVDQVERESARRAIVRARLGAALDATVPLLAVVVALARDLELAGVLFALLLSGIIVGGLRRLVTLGLMEVNAVRGAGRVLEDVFTAETRGQPDPPDRIGDCVQVTDLAYRRSAHAKPVFHGVSFAVPSAGRFFLLGRTGAGKSTLARVLVGTLPAAHGSITRPANAQVSYVAQRALFVEGSVATNVALGRSLTAAQVQDALQLAGLWDVVAARGGPDRAIVMHGASNFSGGERQRLALARAVAAGPRLLVLDEAFSALEDDLTAAILERLADRAIGVLAVCHRLPPLRAGDQVAVLSPVGLSVQRVVERRCSVDRANVAGELAATDRGEFEAKERVA